MAFTLFADDTNSLITNHDLSQLRNITIEELQKISKWLTANRIKANHSKTHFMVFKGKRKLNYSLRITFEGKNLVQKNSSKMLGVLIDDKLRWTEHINSINSKISRAIGILHKFSKTLHSNTLKLIYNSILQPYLQYCNVLWGNAAKSNLQPLFRSQKKAIRKISHAAYLDHTNNLFRELKILKLDELNMLETSKFVYKEMSKPASHYFTKRRTYLNMRLRANANNELQLPIARSERAKKFITYHGVKLWNNIPLEVRQATNPITFKIKLKKFLLTRYEIQQG